MITKRLEWDAGHRVLGHGGKCRHLHGHRYAAEVTCHAPRLNNLGMVVDFSCIKQEVGGWIDTNWDHNMILHPDDPLCNDHNLAHVGGGTHKTLWSWFCEVHGRKPFVMPVGWPNPTAENMAEFLFHKATALLKPHGVTVVSVRLYETPTCSAVYPDPEERS